MVSIARLLAGGRLRPLMSLYVLKPPKNAGGGQVMRIYRGFLSMGER